MNDSDQTIISGGGTSNVPDTPQKPQEGSKRNPLLLIGGIGCVLLLCAGLLIGGGIYLAGDQIRDLAGLSGGDESVAAEEVPTQEPEASATPTPEATEDTSATAEVEVAETDSGEAAESTESQEVVPTEDIPPAIGEITFAVGVTEDNEPVDPSDSFEEGITEVHAIFEYSGLSPDDTWERVWYLDGNEMLRSAEAWAGDESGTFDYFINAGGDALTPGEWVLELYVDDNLLATGNFTIKSTAEESALVEEPTETTEHAADIATATPTPTAAPTPTPRPAAPVAKTYKLVYTKWDGGRHNIYIGDTDGSTEQFILHNGAGPSWTPNGNSIFFYGEPGVNQQKRDDFPGIAGCELPGISDGIMALPVPPAPFEVCQAQNNAIQGPGWNEGTARWASVSPDGNMVAYDAKPGGNYRIYFLGTADNQQFKFEIDGEQADWSPDSQKVVYRSGRGGQFGIWISNRDDSGHTQITSNGSDSFPAWSPDGNTIAFSRDEGGNVDIYTVNVDGSNLQRLTDAPGPDSLPTYTPSGEIIFRSARSGSWGIWKMSGDGSNQQEIIPNAGVGNDWAYSKMDVLP